MKRTVISLVAQSTTPCISNSRRHEMKRLMDDKDAVTLRGIGSLLTLAAGNAMQEDAPRV